MNRETQIEILENKTFEKLVIKRIGNDCYLVIYYESIGNVLQNKKGNPIIYRHAWQIKNWLLEKFQIDKLKVFFSEIE